MADFHLTRDPELAKTKGLFVAENPFVVQTLIERSHYEVRAVFLAEHRMDHMRDAFASLDPNVAIYVAESSVIDAIAGFRVHRSCLASGVRGQPRTAEQALQSLGPGRRTVVVLEGVSNHDNIGSIFRNASGFGVDAVLLNAEAADPLYRKAIRVSVASTLTVPWGRFGTSSSLLSLLREHGFESWGMTPRAEAEDLDALARRTDSGRRVAIWLGAEGPGLLDETIQSVERAVRIDMAPGPDALNVASASAIALYLATR